MILDLFLPVSFQCKCGRIGKRYAKGLCRSCYSASRYYAAVAADPAMVRELRRQKYLRDQQRDAAYAAAYHKKNLIAKRERLRAWRAANPDKVAEHIRTYRARKKNAPVCDLTAAQWAAIKKLHASRCFYCGRRRKLTQDHVVPLSKGGGHTASNVVPACKSCNSSKGAKLNYGV